MSDIWKTFDLENNLIKEYKHWKLLVRKNQGYFGSCVAITKLHHESLGELTPEEMAEYQVIAKEIESALKRAFDYDGIHHCVLMKNDKHTHFHIFPRYLEPRSFAGEGWNDGFGPFIPGTTKEVSQEVLSQIKKEIIKNLF